MVEWAVRRAKNLALRRNVGGGARGHTADDLQLAVREEFKENEDLPNTSNPDDWAKIAGRKGERIVYVKVLTSEPKVEKKPVERVVTTGQNLYATPSAHDHHVRLGVPRRPSAYVVTSVMRA